jgi:predicted permease
MMKPLRRFFALFRQAKVDAEMSEEMGLHLERRIEENIAAGMSPENARYTALRKFGGVERAKELAREQRGWLWLEQTKRDVGYGLRSLAKSPGFAGVAVLSLAVGIGAGTAIFSVLNAVALRSLPVRAPHELRLIDWVGLNPRLYNYTGSGTSRTRGGLVVGSSFPYPALRAFQDQTAGRASVFGFFSMPRINAVARGEAATISGLMVSGNFFAAYGASTLLGRPLAPEDDRPGAPAVAVITYAMWERRLGLDPGVLGQTVSLNQQAFTIIGVLPRDYVGPLPGDMAEIYVAFVAQPLLASSRSLDSMNEWWVQLMARIAPGADETQMQAALAVPFRQVLEASKTKIDQPGILLEAGAQGAATLMRKRMAMPMLALLMVVGVVVAIACANVAGLLLARGAVRQHEFAVRAAIGASRWRLARQALTESLLLGLAAAVGGLCLAGWGKTVLLGSLGIMPDNFRLDARTDLTVLGFALGSAVLTALVFGLLPALRASAVDPVAGLKHRSALAAPRLRLGRMLVTVQVGLSALLVVGGGLMIRTFANLVRVDPGFNATNLLLFRVDPAQAGIPAAALGAFYADARRSLEAIPGVRAVALTSLLLVGDGSNSNAVEFPGRPAKAGESLTVCELTVSDGYFATLGIPLVLGREFLRSDTAGSPRVAVVNETFVRTFLPEEHPLGRTFALKGQPGSAFTIVGVCRDAKYASLREAIPPVMFLSNQQRDFRASKFVIRSVLPPLALVPAARKAIAAISPNLPISAIRTQEQLVDQSVALDRLCAVLCGGLAGLALLLACIGLYGLLAYNVARRTGEIGLRMALGATRRNILGPIIREALVLAGAGLAVGLPAAFAIARLIRSQLYGVGPADPLTLVAGAGLLLGLAALSAWLPARRAAKVDPMVALRAE